MKRTNQDSLTIKSLCTDVTLQRDRGTKGGLEATALYVPLLSIKFRGLGWSGGWGLSVTMHGL
jgi:hypothetical protein